MFALIYIFIWGHAFTYLSKKMKIFQILYTKWKNGGDDIINSLISIFISTVQELFRRKLHKFKISHLPYFFIRFTSYFHSSVPTYLVFLLN